VSEEKCVLLDDECPLCNSQTSKTSCEQYDGCNFCESGYCSEKEKSCPVCSNRGKDDCQFEDGVPLPCKYCNSSQECVSIDAVCSACSSVKNPDTCASLAGCVYCQSTMQCYQSDEQPDICECDGLSFMPCMQAVGCVWSTANSKCVAVGEESGSETSNDSDSDSDSVENSGSKMSSVENSNSKVSSMENSNSKMSSESLNSASRSSQLQRILTILFLFILVLLK